MVDMVHKDWPLNPMGQFLDRLEFFVAEACLGIPTKRASTARMLISLRMAMEGMIPSPPLDL